MLTLRQPPELRETPGNGPREITPQAHQLASHAFYLVGLNSMFIVQHTQVNFCTSRVNVEHRLRMDADTS